MKKIIPYLFAASLLLAAGLIILRNFTSARSAGQNLVKAVNPTFLFLSDIHLNTTSDSTQYGSDTGMRLWANFLAQADAVLAAPNSPRFIVYTGDLPAHYHCDSTCYLPPGNRSTHNQNIKVILTGLRKLADKHHKALFYMPGNNDGLAGDYYSFADEQQQTPFSLVPDSSNPFPAVNINRGSNKAPCMVANPHPTMGYYAVRPVDGLRLICLNTVIFNYSFRAVDGSTQQKDGDTQMAWLATQLAEAKLKKEKVCIAMHIPPGLDAYSCHNTPNCNSMWVKLPGQKQTWLNTFLLLTARYQSTISGILYGHTHMDEVRRLYDSTGTRITEVAISCPGVTPQHYNNPGFKTVQYDMMSKELMDFTTYYTTPVAGSWGNGTYSFRSAFGALPAQSIYQRLSAMPLSNVTSSMNSIFTVQNGAPTYQTQGGIEVKWGQ